MEQKIIEGSAFYPKRDSLKKIRVDSDNWYIYYLDEKTNEKWVEESPDSKLNGGGAPQLRLLEKFPWE